jgi:hypothetical protein
MSRHIATTTDHPSETYLQLQEMIVWFHSSFHRIPNKNTESFRRALLFYFWDEWLTMDEQQYLLRSTGMNLHEMIRDNQYPFGKMMVNRYLHPKTGLLYYTCEEGKECVQSVVDQIKRSTTDPLRQLQVNKRTTGPFYGYLAPKDGHFVFKTNKSPDVNGKIGRGSECIIVSNIKEHLLQLLSIGELVQRSLGYDFELNRDTLLESRKIKSSIRVCTLMNLLLRLMDGERIDGKRWFFRPVEAYYTGHKGTAKE